MRNIGQWGRLTARVPLVREMILMTLCPCLSSRTLRRFLESGIDGVRRDHFRDMRPAAFCGTACQASAPVSTSSTTTNFRYAIVFTQNDITSSSKDAWQATNSSTGVASSASSCTKQSTAEGTAWPRISPGRTNDCAHVLNSMIRVEGRRSDSLTHQHRQGNRGTPNVEVDLDKHCLWGETRWWSMLDGLPACGASVPCRCRLRQVRILLWHSHSSRKAASASRPWPDNDPTVSA